MSITSFSGVTGNLGLTLWEEEPLVSGGWKPVMLLKTYNKTPYSRTPSLLNEEVVNHCN